MATSINRKAASTTPKKVRQRRSFSHEFKQVVGKEPSLEFAAEVEEYERLMKSLGDETLEQLATWKLEGYTNAEIAQKGGQDRTNRRAKIELDSEDLDSGVGEGLTGRNFAVPP